MGNANLKVKQPPPPIDLETVKRVWWVNPHKTGDSFMLMLYVSQDHSVTEFLWNSREGVTPFGIRSRDGKVDLYHQRWDWDIYCPNYKPAKGMRIFVGMTRERAREFAVRNVERWWDHPKYPMSKQYHSKEEAVNALAEEYYSEHGEGETPDVIEVDDAWLEAHDL